MRCAISISLGVLLLACRPGNEPGPPDSTAANEERAPDEVEPVDDPPPLEVPQRINAEYEGKDAKDWQRRFEREGRDVFDHRDAILELFALRPGMAVADVGAGTGLFTLPIARAVAPGGRVYAVDVQAYMLASIAERARAAKLDNIVTVTADQRATGLAEGSIDLAVLVDSYHHLERPTAYLADLRRALRADGRLVVVDFDRTVEHADRWMKDHVRADPDAFLREIEAAGFRLRERPALLRENFVFVLEKT